MLSVCLILFTLLAVIRNSQSSVLSRPVTSTDSEPEPPHVWPVPLMDATHLCGNGCVQIKLSDLARKVPIELLTVASLFFYEQGTPTNWSVFHQNQEQYEIYTLNHHKQRHHTIAQFTIESEEFYKTNWRSADLLHKIQAWYSTNANDAEFSIVLKKIGDTDQLNSRFAYDANSRTQPFILVGVPPAEDPDRQAAPRQRIRRDTSIISRPCEADALASGPCCVATKYVDLDDFNDQTHHWWISPRNFNMTYCNGICRMEYNYYYRVLNLYSDSIQSSCRPAEFADFEIWVSIAGNFTKSVLKYFSATSCRCL